MLHGNERTGHQETCPPTSYQPLVEQVGVRCMGWADRELNTNKAPTLQGKHEHPR